MFYEHTCALQNIYPLVFYLGFVLLQPGIKMDFAKKTKQTVPFSVIVHKGSVLLNQYSVASPFALSLLGFVSIFLAHLQGKTAPALGRSIPEHLNISPKTTPV